MSDTTLKQDIEKRYGVDKKFCRANEAKERLGIGLSTVWYYAKIGKLTPKKISPRVTLFSIDEINELINNAEVA